MFNPFNSGMRVLTLQDLDLNLNGIDSQTTLSDVDDDIDFNIGEGNQKGYAVERELPQNNFNIRTLTQDKIEEMKRNSNIEWVLRL